VQTIQRQSLLLDEVEVRFGLAGGALVIATFVAGAFRVPPGFAFPVQLLICALLAATLTRPLALLLGLASWALFTGFSTNAYGQLTFGQQDLLLMVEFLGLAVAASHLTRSVLPASDRPGRTP
jgi:hypothetical protein